MEGREIKMTEAAISSAKDKIENLIAHYQIHEINDELGLGKKIYERFFGINEIKLPLKLFFNPHAHGKEFCFPYELITTRSGNQVCRTNTSSLIRIVRSNDLASQKPLRKPVRILIVIASPKTLDPIDGKREISELQQALGAYYDSKIARFTIIEEGDTRKKLKHAMRQKTYDIVEFIAHGTNDYHSNGGAIFFEDDKREPEPINGNHLGEILKPSRRPPPRLVFLNSCLTVGTKVPEKGFSSVAWHLLVKGIPAVIAMQDEVETQAAANVGAAFYRKLFSPAPLDECVGAMRGELGDKFYAPVLAIREGTNLEIFHEDTKQFLRKAAKINDEIDVLSRDSNKFAKLVAYLKELDPEYYSLMHKGDLVADLLYGEIAKELNISL